MAVPASMDPGAVRPWVKPLARAGFAARGLVYVIVGFFAVLAAFGRSEVKGTEGALATLLSQPFGTALLWLAIVESAAAFVGRSRLCSFSVCLGCGWRSNSATILNSRQILPRSLVETL